MPWSLLAWAKLAYLITLRSYHVNALNDSDDAASMGTDESKQVQVRAVFINCEPDVRDDVASDNAASRFEREELFKHSSLRDCSKKLALTVKLTSEPNQSVGDEYIPIEHVIEGMDKKRLRLLNPYVLCLRRETPQQAYKLRRVDTVKGVLSSSGDTKLEQRAKHKLNLNERDGDSNRDDWTENNGQRDKRSLLSTTNQLVSNDNNCAEVRQKRSEHNIIVEDTPDDDKNKQWISKNPYYQTSDRDLENRELFETASPTEDLYSMGDVTATIKPLKNPQKSHPNLNKTKHTKSYKHIKDKKTNHHHNHKGHMAFNGSKSEFDDSYEKVKEADFDETNTEYVSRFHSKEKDYAVYEIGEPDLWAYVEIQLFEKMINNEGRTVWNDLTKGKDVSVSSLNPEWKSKDMTVMYRPADWLSQDKYVLQGMSLCLLVPVHSVASDAENSTFNDGDYIVVPSDDILAVQDSSDIHKREENQLDADYTTASNEQCNKRVIVRTSRALVTGMKQFQLATRGSDRYLTMPHRSSHHAQIEVEAKADNNELVRVGASGRISTVVTDSTRVTRTVVTVQAANTGLAAARFRVRASDCGPEIFSLNGGTNKIVSAGPFLLPPRHSRNFQLELPIELPTDTVHCSVQLVNDGDESVAVRDLAIKKGDRCFCVWHCDCVCMDDDPKLLCREMTEGRQVAAGLSSRELVRRGRSVCYNDDVYINMITIIFGVIMLLLFLGFVKACLGLVFRCIATLGLSSMIKPPRTLDCYYERSIAWRPVVYDEEGWPVHPDTKQRTVHVTSTRMEFLLNTIFFVAIPCLIVYESIKKCTDQFLNKGKTRMSHDEKIFNSQNLQGIRVRPKRRRKDLQKWMTPNAEHLSSEIIQKGLCPKLCAGTSGDKHMKPLLLDDHLNRNFIGDDMQDSCPDSEQEDTEYVLMQMQKSKESLAKSQRKLQETEKQSLKKK